MTKDNDAHLAQQKVIELFKETPEAALSTVTVTASISDGFLCTVKEEEHELKMDLPPVIGGGNEAPGPGVFARAALAGCILQVLKLTAVRKGIKLKDAELELEVDFDDSAMFGMSENTSPVLRSRIVVSADAGIPAAELTKLVHESLEMDPYFRAWRDEQEVSVRVKSD